MTIDETLKLAQETLSNHLLLTREHDLARGVLTLQKRVTTLESILVRIQESLSGLTTYENSLNEEIKRAFEEKI